MLLKNSKIKFSVFNLKPPTSLCQRKVFNSHWRKRVRDAAIANKNNRFAFYGTDQRGMSVVELAIVVLLFLLLILGLMDVGRGVWAYNTLSHAAREGARYAIVHGSKSNNPATPETIENIVRRRASNRHLNVVTTWPDGNQDQGSDVNVTVQTNYQPLLSIIAIPSIQLSATSKMVISY